MGDVAIAVSNLKSTESAIEAGGTEMVTLPSALTVVVDLRGGALAAEFIDHLTLGNSHILLVSDRPARSSDTAEVISFDEFVAAEFCRRQPVGRIILFLPITGMTSQNRVVEQCVNLAAGCDSCRVCLVSSFLVHFSGARLAETEMALRDSFQQIADQVIVVRPAHVVNGASKVSNRLRWFAPFHPIVSKSFKSCFVDSDELFSVIDAIDDHRDLRVNRTYTLLGPNRRVKDVLAEHVRPGFCQAMLTILSHCLRLLLVEFFIGIVFSVIARYRRQLKQWKFDTLDPESVDELLCLYNTYNYRHVAIAGYNTGVTHFGWKYPGMTVVKTTATGNRVRVRDKLVVVDAGITLKRVVGELTRAGRELYVLPNYSYISMGTTFFVPVHGSGSEVSTLGDTIEKGLLYDPKIDRFVAVRRGEPAFGNYMYNTGSKALLLRLHLRVKERSRYFVRCSRLMSPSAADVWNVFSDPKAANIELRKSRSASSAIDVRKYFIAPTTDEGLLEVPKDAVGRLWDRLEENPVTSFLFHTFVRRFGYHVELFLDEHDFEVFWNLHDTLRLSKIQLRYVRRDGLPHSPVGNCDCISADLFMKRRESTAFQATMRKYLPNAKFNPGKHSM